MQFKEDVPHPQPFFPQQREGSGEKGVESVTSVLSFLIRDPFYEIHSIFSSEINAGSDP